MKKIILIAMYVLVCVAMTSCSDDGVPTENSKIVNMKLTDGQNDPTPIPPLP